MAICQRWLSTSIADSPRAWRVTMTPSCSKLLQLSKQQLLISSVANHSDGPPSNRNTISSTELRRGSDEDTMITEHD
jgi:hypothetical protein